MTTAVTLSVVVPNYNHAKLIGRALQALMAQERAADEIILVDDGSTDDSVHVIEEFAANAPAVTLLRNAHNLGVIPTLERGLRAARGTYVYFGAADDFVLPGFFETALQRLDAVRATPWRCRGGGSHHLGMLHPRPELCPIPPCGDGVPRAGWRCGYGQRPLPHDDLE